MGVILVNWMSDVDKAHFIPVCCLFCLNPRSCIRGCITSYYSYYVLLITLLNSRPKNEEKSKNEERSKGFFMEVSPPKKRQ